MHRQAVLVRQDLSCTYLAHHELESVVDILLMYDDYNSNSDDYISITIISIVIISVIVVIIIIITIIVITDTIIIIVTSMSSSSQHRQHTRPHLALLHVHGLQTGEKQRGRTRRIADRLDEAGNGNDWHVLIQGAGTCRPELHPDGLRHCSLGSYHGLEMRAAVG